MICFWHRNKADIENKAFFSLFSLYFGWWTGGMLCSCFCSYNSYAWYIGHWMFMKEIVSNVDVRLEFDPCIYIGHHVGKLGEQTMNGFINWSICHTRSRVRSSLMWFHICYCKFTISGSSLIYAPCVCCN